MSILWNMHGRDFSTPSQSPAQRDPSKSLEMTRWNEPPMQASAPEHAKTGVFRGPLKACSTPRADPCKSLSHKNANLPSSRTGGDPPGRFLGELFAQDAGEA